MNRCRWEKRVERWFDGESTETDAVNRHLGECPSCRGYVAQLTQLRDYARVIGRCEGIEDARFPIYMAGIRERIQAPRQWYGGLWAMASLAAAALIIGFSTLIVLTGHPSKAKATSEIESVVTEIEGATVDAYSGNHGDAVVWVRFPDGEM